MPHREGEKKRSVVMDDEFGRTRKEEVVAYFKEL
jgi:hypothetical protein